MLNSQISSVSIVYSPAIPVKDVPREMSSNIPFH